MNPEVSAQAGGDQVCAVVVTYNRKDLLRECLAALLSQTRPVDRILVIDNQSTDGTLEMLASSFSPESFSQIEVVTLERNVGGAGGFHEGLKRAAAGKAAWVWLMDDDTIPAPNALAELLAARARFPAGREPDLLGSQVRWTDGSLHPMNTQWVKIASAEENFRAAQAGTIPLRTTTFVSMLIRRSLVERYGLPIASYFIATDDVEYTARILKTEFGVAVPNSIVIHKTPTKAGTLEAPPQKFFYYVRNTVWMVTRSDAFRFSEATKLALRFVASLGIYLKRTRFASASLNAIARGLWHGVTRAP